MVPSLSKVKNLQQQLRYACIDRFFSALFLVVKGQVSIHSIKTFHKLKEGFTSVDFTQESYIHNLKIMTRSFPRAMDFLGKP